MMKVEFQSDSQKMFEIMADKVACTLYSMQVMLSNKVKSISDSSKTRNNNYNNNNRDDTFLPKTKIGENAEFKVRCDSPRPSR